MEALEHNAWKYESDDEDEKYNATDPTETKCDGSRGCYLCNKRSVTDGRVFNVSYTIKTVCDECLPKFHRMHVKSWMIGVYSWWLLFVWGDDYVVMPRSMTFVELWHMTPIPNPGFGVTGVYAFGFSSQSSRMREMFATRTAKELSEHSGSIWTPLANFKNHASALCYGHGRKFVDSHVWTLLGESHHVLTTTATDDMERAVNLTCRVSEATNIPLVVCGAIRDYCFGTEVSEMAPIRRHMNVIAKRMQQDAKAWRELDKSLDQKRFLFSQHVMVDQYSDKTEGTKGHLQRTLRHHKGKAKTPKEIAERHAKASAAATAAAARARARDVIVANNNAEPSAKRRKVTT